jgi:hypothetical protein
MLLFSCYLDVVYATIAIKKDCVLLPPPPPNYSSFNEAIGPYSVAWQYQ